MNAVRLGDVLDPEKNLREWAKRGGESPQKGSPAAAMQWAVAELDAARARVAELEADLLKVEGFRADLADRSFRQAIELDELRAVAKADR